MKGKVFSIATLMLLATSISTSAFYPTLSGHKSGNLLSYRAQTTTNQNASRCSVAISFINSKGSYSYIESASDKLGSHESGRALNATVSNGAYNAFGAKGLYSEHYANENNDYQEDTHKGTFDSNGNLRLQW
ncbi:TPA: hypothetical protein QCR36_002398 [Bacillus cereus]|uniref:Uncharacterized protein n=8 Tax=Bacillus TaxID=1386 RepID=A0A0J1KV17_BACAN|nr:MULTISPECIES: hypothetical protein [Bacillus]ADY20047.1 hypothetical protein YBT020_04005 [Bacillus thuringiensis serovar finitimus YBT-020]EDX70167.1 conserved hypothetical protein [Bacillus cereus NVH0597-99]EEL47139.1 hypothetical protein bcere0021_6460 [Bacillus cereus Rock3-42]MCW4575954.1 hypothetical protein [Bacillus pacificus]HDR4493407.1 hypothetical protein [Bacillus cereus biovar anthracis]